MPIFWPHLDGEASDEELVAEAMAGNDWALDLLLARYRDFVRLRARKLFLPGAERADLVQEGMIGLYRAVVHFDPAGGRDFRPYADVCVRRQMSSAVSAATRRKNAPLTTAVRFDAVVRDSTGEDAAAPSEEGAPERVVLDRESVRGLSQFLRSALTAFEHDVLAKYLEGGTYERISAELGRPVKSVDNALQRVRRKITAFRAKQE